MQKFVFCILHRKDSSRRSLVITAIASPGDAFTPRNFPPKMTNGFSCLLFFLVIDGNWAAPGPPLEGFFYDPDFFSFPLMEEAASGREISESLFNPPFVGSLD